MKTKKMKRFSQRALSMLLVLVILAGVLPVAWIHTAAASNMGGGGLTDITSDTYSTLDFGGVAQDVFSALGFDVSVLPEGYDVNTVDNPYGRDKIPGKQIFEALVASKSGTGIFGKDDNNVTYDSVNGDPTSGVKLPFEFFAATAADLDGDGLTGEVAYVGFENTTPNDVTGRPKMYLMIYDAKSDALSEGLELGSTNPAQVIPKGGEKYSSFDYAWQNLLQITAGDYDGDGAHEIAVYVPQHGRVRVDIYKYMKTSASPADGWLTVGNWEAVWSYTISNGDGEIPNMVSLVSADINRDGVDDLGISYGRFAPMNNNGSFSSAITNSKAFMLWGSRENMLQEQYPIDLNDSGSGFGNLARVSLTTGDLDGDGYKELIATGHPVYDLTGFFANGYYVSDANTHKQNTARTVTTYIYDSVEGLIINASELLRPVDGEMTDFEYTDDDGSDRKGTAWTSNNGFDQRTWSIPVMRTNAAVVRLEGHEYPFLYLDSSLYEYTEGKLTLKMALDEDGNLYDGENTLKAKGDVENAHWGTSGINKNDTPNDTSDDFLDNSSYAEFGAVSADINGSGYDVLMTGFFRDSSRVNKSASGEIGNWHANAFGVLSSGADGILAVKMDYHGITKANDSHDAIQLRYPVMLDADVDTVIIEYTGQHWLTYSDPKVLAVIAAAPYFEDVEKVSGGEYAWQNTTSYSRVNGSGTGDHITVDFSVGAYVEASAGIVGVKAATGGYVGFTLNYEEESVSTTEYTLTFETSGGEDQVAFFSLPTENYKYRIYTPDGNGGYEITEEIISNDFTPVYQVLTLDYYETVQQMYPGELPVLSGVALTSTPGDPASYPSSTSGYDVIAQWNDDPAGVSFGNGSITQEITITQEESERYTLGAQTDFKLGAGAYTQSDMFQAMADFEAGVEFSLNPAGGWSKFNLSGTTISGTVANMPTRFQDYGYYYSWSIFAYKFELGKKDALGLISDYIPVISYVVNDVSAPPELPKDFQQDVERTTSDKNVLTWSYDGSFSKFIIHKYYEFPVGGGLQEIAQITSDTPNYRVKYDENGDLYKEYYFEDTNLTPYTEYTYAIQVERLDKTPPLSSPSALLTVRTKAEYGYPSVVMDESDGENNAALLVYPDKTSYITALVSGTNGESMSDFYTVVQYQWQKKVNGAWVDLEGETSVTLTFADVKLSQLGEYRCRLNLLVKENANAITTYTDPVTVSVSLRSAYFEDAYVMDAAGGKITVYAKVANAHSDSSTIPTGSVNLILQDNKTGNEYKSTIPLDTAGVATATVSGLPAGVYNVTAIYLGDSIFKLATGENVYLSKQLLGYDVSVPDGIVYGDGAELVNRKIFKDGNMSVTESAKPDGYTVYLAARLSGNLIPNVTLAGEATEGKTLRVGYQYTYAHEGKTYYFVAPRGLPRMPAVTVQNGYLLFAEANDVLEYSGFDGDYLISAAAPAGSYLVIMNNQGEAIEAYFEIARRPITAQLPSQKTALGYVPPNVYLGELALVSGSYAPHDLNEDGTLPRELYEIDIYLDYINTAGTHYTLYEFYENLGYYIMRDNGDNDKSPRPIYENYDVTYLDGSVVVFGGARSLTAGTRYFEEQSVGTLYVMSPEYGYTKGNVTDGAIEQAYAIGNRVVFTAVPDAGYEIYDWFINGIAQGSTATSLAYVMAAEDVTVEVQFTLSRNTLKFEKLGDVEGGSLTANNFTLTSGSMVLSNSYYVFTATADEGYHFKEWRYSEEGKGTAYDATDEGKASSTFELLMPDASCSVFAVFERDSYILEVSDRSGGDGVVAWYVGNATGDSTVSDERIYVKSGDRVKGDTLITVEAAAGYSLDTEYAFVTSGSIGTADYEAGRYTFTLTTDTAVSAVAVRNSYDLDIAFDAVPYEKDGEQIGSPLKATLTVSIDGEERVIEYSEDNTSATLSDIPGGSRVKLTLENAHYYDFIGYEYAELKLIASDQVLRLATKLLDGEAVEAGAQYWYSYANEDGYTTVGYFTSPADGTVSLDGSAVTVFSSAREFSFEALAKDESISIRLVERPVYRVEMPDTSGKGEYTLVEYPDGAVLGDGFVAVHAGDAITVLVTPNEAWTVSYWNIEDLDGVEDYRVRVTSLKYTFTDIYKNVRMTPEFSSSAYHDVVWDTVAADKNGVILSPEAGSLPTVQSGGSFSFRLSTHNRPQSDIKAVYANGEPLTAENGVYTVTNVFKRVEITVELNAVGIQVDGVDVTYLNGHGWSYDKQTSTLTLTGDGLTLTGASTGKIEITASVRTLKLGDASGGFAQMWPFWEERSGTSITTSASNLIFDVTGAVVLQDRSFAFDNLTVTGNGEIDFNSLQPQGFTANSLTVKDGADVRISHAEGDPVLAEDFLLNTAEISIKGENSVLRVNGRTYSEILTIEEGELIITSDFNALTCAVINVYDGIVELKAGVKNSSYRALTYGQWNLRYSKGYIFTYNDSLGHSANKYKFGSSLDSVLPNDEFEILTQQLYARIAPAATVERPLTVQIEDYDPQDITDTVPGIYAVDLTGEEPQFHVLPLSDSDLTDGEVERLQRLKIYAIITEDYGIRFQSGSFDINGNSYDSGVISNLENSFNYTLSGLKSGMSTSVISFIWTKTVTLDNFIFDGRIGLAQPDPVIRLVGDNYVLSLSESAFSPFITPFNWMRFVSDGTGTLTTIAKEGAYAFEHLIQGETMEVTLDGVARFTLYGKAKANYTYVYRGEPFPSSGNINSCYKVYAGDDAASARRSPYYDVPNYFCYYALNSVGIATPVTYDRAVEENVTTELIASMKNGVPQSFDDTVPAELVDAQGRAYPLSAGIAGEDVIVRHSQDSGIRYDVTVVAGRRTVSLLDNGTYTLRLRYSDGSVEEIAVILTDTASDKDGDRITPRYSEATAGSRIVFEYEFDRWENGHSFAWLVNGERVENNGLSLNYRVPASAEAGDGILVSAVRYDAQGVEYNRVTASVRVIASASVIEVKDGDTVIGAEGYALDYEANSALTWDFDARVTLNDGTVIEDASVLWSVGGSNMRLTAIDASGVLTVSEKEGGTDGKITLTAMYRNADGSECYYTVDLLLPETLCTSEEYRLTHNYDGGTVTPPTCTEKGYTTHACLACGYSYRTDVTDETGHSFTVYTENGDATCTQDGTESAKCDACDATDTRSDADSATGHGYDNACDTDCNACGEARAAAEHADADQNDLCDECGASLPSEGLSGGAIAGIAVGSAAVIGGGGFALFWFVIRKKRVL